MRPKIRIHASVGRMAAATLGLASLALAAPAAAVPTNKLQQAGVIASPSVVLIEFSAKAYLNDNRDGSTHGPYSLDYLGTGFFVSSDGYIATASHLAALTNDQIKDLMVESYLQEDANHTGCQARGNCTALIDQYRAGYQVATSLSELQSDLTVFTQDMNAASRDTVGLPAQLMASSPVGQSDVAIVRVNSENDPVLPLGNAEQVRAQDPVSIIGYPGIGNTSAQTLLVPTVTTGSITALKQGSADLGYAPGISIFQTDATVEHGNSGGPAINEDGQVIGLVSFGETSTTNFLISVKEIRDELRRAGGSNALGQIDHLWRQGLTYFEQHRYPKAKAAFEQCLALNKVQVGCAQQEQKAAGLLSQDQEWNYATRSGFPFRLTAGIVGALVLLAVIGLGIMLLTRRGSRRPAQGRPATLPPQPMVYAAQPYPPPAPHSSSTSVGFVPRRPAPAAAPAASSPAVIQTRYCSGCGNEVSGKIFCDRCGQRTGS